MATANTIKLRGKFKDLTGRVFGKWTAMECVGKNRHNRALWNCHCECGTTRIMPSSALLTGETKSCGCDRLPRIKTSNMAGLRFGEWTVIETLSLRYRREPFCLCVCSCGTKREVAAHNLKQGASLSCGCIGRKKACDRHFIHGLTETSEHHIWKTMIARCENKRSRKYASYGARGIRVCPKWRASFIAFLNDMGRRPTPRHSIDRINNEGNYEPSNCRWATPTEQSCNRRVTIYVEFNGRKAALSEACRETNTKYERMRERIKRGLTFDEAVSRKPYDVQTKLTWEMVDQIRNIGHSQTYTKTAFQFGVSKSLIGKVIGNKIWKPETRPRLK